MVVGGCAARGSLLGFEAILQNLRGRLCPSHVVPRTAGVVSTAAHFYFVLASCVLQIRIRLMHRRLLVDWQWLSQWLGIMSGLLLLLHNCLPLWVLVDCHVRVLIQLPLLLLGGGQVLLWHHHLLSDVRGGAAVVVVVLESSLLVVRILRLRREFTPTVARQIKVLVLNGVHECLRVQTLLVVG